MDELSMFIATIANFIDRLSLFWLTFSDETVIKKAIKMSENSEHLALAPATMSFVDMYENSAPSGLRCTQGKGLIN